MATLLSYLRENEARLQWRRPRATVRVDVTVIMTVTWLIAYIVFALSRSVKGFLVSNSMLIATQRF